MRLFSQEIKLRRLLGARRGHRSGKPRVLLLVDRPGWAFDTAARQFAYQLRREFHFQIAYVHHGDQLAIDDYDLVYVFFWGETYHRRFGCPPERVIKDVSSHRWEDDPRYGPCTPSEMVERHLNDAMTVTTTSLRIEDLIKSHHPRVYHTPKGFDPRRFYPTRKRSGALTIGWAGNPQDPAKCLKEVLHPACEQRFCFVTAAGNVPHNKMNRFYNNIDVIAVSSRHEGDPYPLIEAMATGCFPVCNDVGIAPELIRSGENGLIVPENTSGAFRAAFTWCEENLDHVRKVGAVNARTVMSNRTWAAVTPHFRRALVEALEVARMPRFRNDDVSFDTCLERFQEFCQVFSKYGLTQLHGITLRGRTNSILCPVLKKATQYEGQDELERLPNDRIRELSRGLCFESRYDLVDFLAKGSDDIALHGLYHTDYSKMTMREQRSEIKEGLGILRNVFPRKVVRYFIAPFNRINDHTKHVCSEFGLHLLADSGIHLEATLDTLSITPRTWYRYHHHRFYFESAFDYFELSLAALDAGLSRNFCEGKRAIAGSHCEIQ